MRTGVIAVTVILTVLSACNGDAVGSDSRPISEVRVISGADQTVLAGYPADTVVVRVVDDLGHGVPNVVVAISTDPTAMALSVEEATSDEHGEVRLGWVPALDLGVQQLRVNVPAAPSIAALTVTATTVSNPIRALAGDGSAMCAVDLQGRLGCWSRPLLDQPAPSLLLAATNERFRDVALFAFASEGPRGCAVSEAGRLWCFEVSDGGVVEQIAEVPGSYASLRSVESFGGATWTPFMCGLDLANHAWCWGDNEWGSLGDGTTIDRMTPVAVSGANDFSSLTVGATTACGLDAAGAAWCWGRNDDSQLGLPTEPQAVSVPTLVPTDLRFTSLGLPEADGVCGVATIGGAWCWGLRHILGRGPSQWELTAGSPEPGKVVGGIAPSGLIGSGGAIYAIAPGGAAWFWGNTPLSIIPDTPYPLTGFPPMQRLLSGTGFGVICGSLADPTRVLCVSFIHAFGFDAPRAGFGVPFPA